MPSDWLKALYRSNNRLLCLIYEFNFFPTRYMHRDWVEELLPDGYGTLYEKLLANPRAERRLSEFILAGRNIEGGPFHDFQELSHRFALLDPDSLGQLLLYTGIATGARWISHQIERTAVALLKESLGEKGYLFALKKAPFLIGNASFPSTRPEQNDKLLSFLLASAVQCLKLCLHDAPSSLVQRMLLKLPRELAGYWEEGGDLVVGDRRQVQMVMKRILFKEVSSEWAPYFS